MEAATAPSPSRPTNPCSVHTESIGMSTKICSVCTEPKLLTEYHRWSYSSDGYKSACKLCTRKRQDGYVTSRGGVVRVRPLLAPGDKYCTKCRAGKSDTLFAPKSSWCRECRRLAEDTRRRQLGLMSRKKRDPKLHALRLRECFLCNKVLSINLFNHTARGDHGLRPYCEECDKKHGREYATGNRELINRYLRDIYRKTDYYRVYHRHETHLRRAIEKGSDVDVLFLRGLYGVDTCFYCGRHTACNQRTADHVTPLASKGTHSKSNLVMACRKCNFTKGSRPLQYLLDRLPVERQGIVEKRLWDLKQK